MKALSLAIGVAFLVGDLQATNRYFPDLETTSPSGRFRVEAKSPANREGPWRSPFQDRFLYRQLEKGKAGEAWSRQQPAESPGEGPPVALYVSDDGWLVIRTADVGHPCELVAVDPAGQDRLRVDILKTLLPDIDSLYKYTSHSTAGVRWGDQQCCFYFVGLSGKPHFCVTTWWGQRLLLDLSGGRVVTDVLEFEPELMKLEKAFVLTTLEATRRWTYKLDERINPGLAKDSPGPTVQDVLAAMLLAAKLKILEAAPSVRELEASPVVLTTVGRSFPYEAGTADTKPGVYQNLTLRQAAQLCLRRLGLRPSTHQSTRLYRQDTYWQPEDPLPFQREKRLQGLQSGMKPEEILALVGAPDFITPDGWEYDLDGHTPATLIIRWGTGGFQTSETLEPPKWRNGVERDRELLY